jgi:hypothetical protein
VQAPAEIGGNLRRWDCRRVSWRIRGISYPRADMALARTWVIEMKTTRQMQ